MRRLLFLVLLALPFAGASAQQSAVEAQLPLLQQMILPGLSAETFTADDALDTISGWFSESEFGHMALGSFGVGIQGNMTLVGQQGVGNEVFVDQAGTGNVSAVLQAGDWNEVALAQSGIGNVIGVHITGSNNSLGFPGAPGVVQTGDGNIYLLEVATSNNVIPPTLQVGMENQVVQMGDIIRPFGVEQYGTGMRMIIHHNPVD